MTLPKYQSLFGEDLQNSQNTGSVLNTLNKNSKILDMVVLELLDIKKQLVLKHEATQRFNGSIGQRFSSVTEKLDEFQLNFENIFEEVQSFANQEILFNNISDSSVLILKHKLVARTSNNEVSNSVFSVLLEIKHLLRTPPEIVAYGNSVNTYSLSCFQYNQFLQTYEHLFPLWKNYKIKNSEIAFNKLISTQMGRRFGR